MIFGYEEEELAVLGGLNTGREIRQQPGMWRETYELVLSYKESIQAFLRQHAGRDTRILFTGAGTSDYIGDTIRGHIEEVTGAQVEAVASTDIVADPQSVINRNKKTLLVSFARSGNSPESIGAYHIMQDNTAEISHVIITCNKEGALAAEASGRENSFVLLLPEETEDKGFAMTSSFSCMMLAALLFFDIDRIGENRIFVERIAGQAEKILDKDWREIASLSEEEPERVVYLGAGCFGSLAQELALKNMELTGGRIATLCETVLGFRHGPKTFMDSRTDVIILMSLNDYTNRYSKDLIREIYGDSGRHKLIVLSYLQDTQLGQMCDCYLEIGGEEVPEAYAALDYVLYGQMFGLFNSLHLGIEPDNPSPDGTVNRVVKGVILHRYEEG